MKTLLTMMLLVLPALAQDPSAIARATAACGPPDQYFEVKIDKSNHPLGQPESGKALVYIIQADESGATNFWGHSTSVITRLGLDGAWIGANKGRSYFFFNVAPGDRHLCADYPSDTDEIQYALVSVTRFTAAPGKIYYFRVRLTGNGCGSSTHPSSCRPTQLDIETVDEDKGQFLVASSRFSRSHAQN